MFSLGQRAKALENIYIYDQEEAFRVRSMRNKLLGHWAASLIAAQNATEYADEIAAAAAATKDSSAAFQKIHEDFEKAGVTVVDDEIHDRVRDLLQMTAEELRVGLENFTIR